MRTGRRAQAKAVVVAQEGRAGCSRRALLEPVGAASRPRKSKRRSKRRRRRRRSRRAGACQPSASPAAHRLISTPSGSPSHAMTQTRRQHLPPLQRSPLRAADLADGAPCSKRKRIGLRRAHLRHPRTWRRVRLVRLQRVPQPSSSPRGQPVPAHSWRTKM